MRRVAIVGVSQTPVGEHWESSLRMLAAEAVNGVLKNSGLKHIDALYVGNAYGTSLSSQSQLGALIADYSGLGNIEAYTVEAAEASGGAALRTAYLAVASGIVETAMVVGVEKSTDRVGGARILARNVSLDADYEGAHGVTLTALAAMLMRRYMHEYDLELSAFEGFSINAHANGSLNPKAMFRNSIKSGRFAKAPMISDPVSLFDSAPDADGAAAVILTTLERAADLVPRPIQIAGSAVATDTVALHDRKEPLFFRSAHVSASRALSQAGLQKADIDLFELHDTYTIMTTLTLEATGFAAQGRGWELASSNTIALNGSLPISTFGGLKARGNPVGATGVYQVVEATLQLQQAAGDNQVMGAQYAMVQNLGGLAATAVTHILSSV